jgi:hypothetical protein
MIIPDRMKIGGHWFTIKIKNSEDGFSYSGIQFPRQGLILLQEELIQSKKESVLFHEVIHELCWQAEIDISETAVSIIAEGLYQVLKDNNMLNNKEE